MTLSKPKVTKKNFIDTSRLQTENLAELYVCGDDTFSVWYT